MSDSKKRKLAKDLNRSSEYRESYGEQFATERMATQIKMLRTERELSQSELGKRIGSNQGRVSVFEDKDYGNWSLETLRKLASEFGVWMKVSFEPYSALLREATSFDPANLVHPSWERDPEVQRWLANETSTPTDAFRASAAASPSPLIGWLQGQNLPGFDAHEQTPGQYLLETIPVGDKKTWDALERGLAAILNANPDELTPGIRHLNVFHRNLFGFVTNFPEAPRALLQDALDTVYQRVAAGTDELGPDGRSGLVLAMIEHQVDHRWREVWREFLRRDSHPNLPGYTSMGLRGLLGLPRDSGIYWKDLASGIHDIELRCFHQDIFRPTVSPNVVDELVTAFSTIFDWHAEPTAARNLLLHSQDLIPDRATWSTLAVESWSHVVGERGWRDLVEVPEPVPRASLMNALAEGNQYVKYQKAAGRKNNNLAQEEKQADDASRNVGTR